MKENLFDVQNEDVPRWHRIRESLHRCAENSKSLGKALDVLINLEIGRNVATPSTTAKGKHKSRLSQEWSIMQFNIPNIDVILQDTRELAFNLDNQTDTYARDLIDDNGRWLITFIADEKTISECDPSEIMAAVIGADDLWDKWVIKANKDRGNRHIEDDIWEALDGNEWAVMNDFPPEHWKEIWDYAELNVWPKKYIVVKTGFNALVLSRDLYEFVMFYLTSLDDDIGRLPCKNDKILARKTDFKPPSLMKNFRFDATNVRALESAVATAGGTLVSYIDDLLKTYLGAIVAKRLIDNPPKIGDAYTALKEFNELNKPFGFTVVDDLHALQSSQLSIPALVKDHEAKIKDARRREMDAITKSKQQYEEIRGLLDKLNRAKHERESMKDTIIQLTQKHQDALSQIGFLKVQLDALNDNAIQAVDDVAKPLTIHPKTGDVIEAFPSRDEVSDMIHEDINQFKDKIVKLEKQFMEVGEMKETLKAVLETMKSKEKSKDK